MQGTQKSQTNPGKKKTRLEYWTHTFWFQNLLQSYNNQDSVYWHKDRQIDQWNRIEEQLIFYQGAKIIQWGKKCLKQVVLGQLYNCMQKSEAVPLPHIIFKK